MKAVGTGKAAKVDENLSEHNSTFDSDTAQSKLTFALLSGVGMSATGVHSPVSGSQDSAEARAGFSTHHPSQPPATRTLTLPVSGSLQVWSLTQLYSVDFSQSRICVKKCVFNKRTIKV